LTAPRSTLVAAFLALHGAIHSIGFFVRWRLADVVRASR